MRTATLSRTSHQSAWPAVTAMSSRSPHAASAAAVRRAGSPCTHRPPQWPVAPGPRARAAPSRQRPEPAGCVDDTRGRAAAYIAAEHARSSRAAGLVLRSCSVGLRGMPCARLLRLPAAPNSQRHLDLEPAQNPRTHSQIESATRAALPPSTPKPDALRQLAPAISRSSSAAPAAAVRRNAGFRRRHHARTAAPPTTAPAPPSQHDDGERAQRRERVVLQIARRRPRRACADLAVGNPRASS